MAAPEVFHDLVEISLCELDDWDGGVGALDADSQIQGNGCLTITESTAGLKAIRYETVTQVDMTGKMMIGCLTFARLAMLETAANGGLRFCAQDSSGRDAQWYIGGSNTLSSAGWTPYVAHFDTTPDEFTAGFDKTAVVKMGYRVNLAIKGIIKWDAFRYGTYIGIKRGTSTPGEEADLNDIWAIEDNVSNKYGLLTKFEGVYFLQGKLVIGSTTDGEDTYFSDKSQVVVFKDVKVPSNFYEIKFQGNTTSNTNINFGEEVGGRGISGFYVSATSTDKRFTFDATDTNNMLWKICGTTFSQASTISFPAFSANRKVLNTNFEKCSEVIANTTTISFSNFISSAARAVKISSASHNVTDSNFINCQTAIHHDVGGSSGTPLEYDYNNLKFAGGTYHIENSASTPNFYINIDRLNGSNPDGAKINNSNGGTTTILPIAVVLTLTGLPAGSDVRIMDTGTTTVLDETDNSGTTFNYSYNYGEYPDVDIIVLHLDYEYFRLDGFTPGASNANLPIPMRADRWYANP